MVEPTVESSQMVETPIFEIPLAENVLSEQKKFMESIKSESDEHYKEKMVDYERKGKPTWYDNASPLWHGYNKLVLNKTVRFFAQDNTH